MFTQLLTKVLGSKNERELKRLRKIVARINALEPEMEPLSDEALKGKTEGSESVSTALLAKGFGLIYQSHGCGESGF